MQDKAHELISKLKELASELGHTPTLAEAEKGGISKHHSAKLFGGYIGLVHASGLEPSRFKKVDNSIFNKDIERHLEEHKSEEIFPPKRRVPYERIACMGDLHEPFSHDGVKQDFKLFVSKFKPKYIFQMGDSMDFFSHAKFPRSHNVFTPKEEEDIAKKNLTEFWNEMKIAAPDAKRVLLVGNHCVRAIKRVLESAPSIEHWAQKYMEDLFTFDDVKTIIDPREEYILNGISFHHGYRSKLGDHRDYMHVNAVVGHTHRGGVVYRNIKNEILWELNCGYAGDPTSKGLSYTSQKLNDWTHGWGAIDEFGPRFIPY